MKKYLIIFLLATKFCNAVITQGYTDKISYYPGETVKFFTKSDQTSGTDQFSIKDINDVNVGTLVTFQFNAQTGNQSSTAYIDGYSYTQTASWVIPSNLKSGIYYFNTSSKIPIVVKSSNPTPDIVVVYPINTIQAYSKNNTDNTNFYSSGSFSPILSFKRPVLSDGQTQIMNSEGFLQWFNQQSYSSFNVITDVDLDADYSLIANAKLLIIIGHSEYWTRQARLNFDSFVDEGHHAMVLSGNTMCWQARYQIDPNNANNPQLICYKGVFGGYQQNDPTMATNPLLETTLWEKPELKYSGLASVGSDWYNGGYGETQYIGNTSIVSEQYSGYGGFYITNPYSPILANTGLNYGSIIPRLYPTLSSGNLATGEFDGAPIVGKDANNDPILDYKALGFYRGEMIGFDWVEYPPSWSGPKSCSPIMAFQKTCSSGKVINTNSNYWCRPSHFSQPAVQTITGNMINLLLGNSDDIWTNQSAPTVFSLKPNTSESVSYSACSDGFISITPCGVQLTNGYKVDNRNSTLTLGYDAASCPTYQALRVANNTTTSSSDVLSPSIAPTTLPTKGKGLNNSSSNNFANDAVIMVSKFSIYPNPANNTITLNLPTNQTTTVTFTDMLGNEILVQNENLKIQSDNHSSTEISIENLPKGIYFVIAKTATKQYVSKLVKK